MRIHSNHLTCNGCISDLERIGLLLDGAGYEYSIAMLLKNNPDTEQTLFRFELFCDRAYQTVGLPQRLDDKVRQPLIYSFVEGLTDFKLAGIII